MLEVFPFAECIYMYCILQDFTRAMSDTIISVHDWGLCAKSHSQNSDQFSCFFEKIKTSKDLNFLYRSE